MTGRGIFAAYYARDGEGGDVVRSNGVGKMATVNTIMGLVAPESRSIPFFSQSIHDRPPYKILSACVAIATEGRQILPNVTLQENLFAAVANWGNPSALCALDSVYKILPSLPCGCVVVSSLGADAISSQTFSRLD